MRAILLSLLVPFSGAAVCAQNTNYDESKVPKYELPDPLQFADGSAVKDAASWRDKRRPQIVKMFEEQMFGRAPGRPAKLEFKVKERATALGGQAIRKQIAIHCGNGEREIVLNLLVYLPVKPRKGRTVFLGLNFNGNHSTQKDPGIELSRSWVRNRKGYGNAKNRATEQSRGTSARRWPVAMVLARDCALATMYYGDIDPDHDDGFKNGVHPLSYRDKQTRPADHEWGSIAAWAWGLSRVVDYFEMDSDIDAKRVVVVGHSRLGKTSLWAGAIDERFAMVVSNDSGCGGAALSRRRFGETVARINKAFPHWFCANFKAFGGKESDLPFDQHMLIALAAPRPVLVCSAEGDRWADPRGEFLAAYHAGPVFRLLGKDAIDSDAMPKQNELPKSRVGYIIRPGKHDMTVTDWKAYLDFADHHGLLKPPAVLRKVR